MVRLDGRETRADPSRSCAVPSRSCAAPSESRAVPSASCAEPEEYGYQGAPPARRGDLLGGDGPGRRDGADGWMFPPEDMPVRSGRGVLPVMRGIR